MKRLAAFLIFVGLLSSVAWQSTRFEIVTVNTVANLDTLSVGNGAMVRTLGYKTVGDGGGNTYRYVSTDVTTEDGGFYIDGPGTGNGRYIAVDQTVINARQWGIAFDGTDEGAAFNTFLAAIKDVPAKQVYIHGSITTTVAIDWVGTDAGAGPENFDCDLEIIGSGTIADYLLTLSGHTDAKFGRIRVVGPGGSTYGARTILDGILIQNCGRTTFTALEADNFQRYGIHVDGDTGNSTLLDIGAVRVSDIGGATDGSVREHSSTWSNPVNTGSTGSTSQFTTVDVVADPQALTKYVDIGGFVYYVKALRAGQIDIYPFIDSGESPGQIVYYDGAGLLIEGSDAARIEIGQLDALGCSVGLDSSALYGPVVRRAVFQACGLGVAYGDTHVSAHITTTIVGAYFETNTFDVVKLTSSDISSTILGATPIDYAKVKAVAPRLTADDSESTTFQRITGLTILDSEVNANTPNLPAMAFGSTNDIYNGDPPIFVRNNNVNVELNYDADTNRLFGHSGCFVVWTGTGVNGQPSTDVDFTTPDATTVNGVSAWKDTPTRATLYVCQYVAGDWEVYGTPLRNVDPTQTATDQDATPSVANVEVLITANTVATTITDFDDPYDGQRLTVVIDDANTTIQHGSTIIENVGGVDITAEGAYQYVYDLANTVWLQVSGNPASAYGGLTVENNSVATTISSGGTSDWTNKVQIASFDTDSSTAINTTPAHGTDDITVDIAGDYLVHLDMSITGTAADIVSFGIFINNGATQMVSRVTQTLTGNVDAVSLHPYPVTFAATDTVEVWVQNETAGRNVTVQDAHFHIHRVD